MVPRLLRGAAQPRAGSNAHGIPGTSLRPERRI